MVQPLVSIIIVNWNRLEDMFFTLDKIREESYSNLEVLIVDNGSTDGSTNILPTKYPEFKYINLNTNLGCEDGYNIGTINAKGEIIIHLDSDAYIQNGGIQLMVDHFIKDIDLGIIDPLIINYHSGKAQNTPENWPKIGTMFTGCAVAIRKKVFNKIGLRPGNFFIYASEPDVSIRTLNAGFKILHEPNIIAFHKESPVKRLSSKFFYYSVRNIIWLVLKYYPTRNIPRELTIHLILNFTLAVKNLSITQYFKGVWHGFTGAFKIIKNERKVLKHWYRGRVYPNNTELIRLIIKKYHENINIFRR